MKWRGRRQSSNVEDHRGSSSSGGFGRMRMPGRMRRVRFPRTARGRGGFSLTSIIIMFVIAWALGINPLTLLTGGEMSSGPSYAPSSQSSSTQSRPQNDELSQFVKVVLAETEDIWHEKFAQSGSRYEEPTLNLFSGHIRSACGMASSASGPFYCPADKDIYIDLSFYAELRKRFEAPGDFAQAYVIAHEVGHHIQNLTGVLPEFNRKRRIMNKAEENAMSIRVELQADCYSGIWAHEVEKKGILEIGDIDEALNAAQQIGDDAIQRRMQGYVVPESFNHGTSEQRRKWFKIGYQSGDVAMCDTFSVANP